MNYTLHHGDCLEILRTLPDNSVDAVVTDPPYGLSFMGNRWDYDVPSEDVWRECFRVLKPGGHLLAFAGTRTQHRMAVRIEDAGFEIRDMIAWVYGGGFPKSLDVSKAIDKMDAAEEQQARRYRFTEWVRSTGTTSKQIDEATGTKMGNHYTTHLTQPAIMTREHLEACRHLLGEVPTWVEQEADIRSVESKNFAEREVVGQKEMTDTTKARAGFFGPTHSPDYDGSKRLVNITAPATDAARQWQGWGTALKPALEPITVARKPLIGTVAENVLTWGTGGVNVDGCRVETTQSERDWMESTASHPNSQGACHFGSTKTGAWTAPPSGRWPANLIHDGSDEVVGLFPETTSGGGDRNGAQKGWFLNGVGDTGTPRPFCANSGSAARFFYCAKASKADRDEGCKGLPVGVVARSCQAQAEAKRGNVVECEEGAFNKARAARNHHPTVKPTDLMRYLCRLVTPPGGIVLDPFMGSGSTGKAAILEGFEFIGIERKAEYLDIARARIEYVEPIDFEQTAEERNAPNEQSQQLTLW